METKVVIPPEMEDALLKISEHKKAMVEQTVEAWKKDSPFNRLNSKIWDDIKPPEAPTLRELAELYIDGIYESYPGCYDLELDSWIHDQALDGVPEADTISDQSVLDMSRERSREIAIDCGESAVFNRVLNDDCGKYVFVSEYENNIRTLLEEHSELSYCSAREIVERAAKAADKAFNKETNVAFERSYKRHRDAGKRKQEAKELAADDAYYSARGASSNAYQAVIDASVK